ncbi:hypothetical protein N9I84_00645 [Gammaproteobacteria bacterium]|nr:hypothetical protein [Gammaproteobacteria bacterium]MDC0014793.1 hypothetical protein [Gammaproteobacteria bacterium]
MVTSEFLIITFVILFLIGAISFLKPSKKMKALSEIRFFASKEGFKIGSTPQLRKKFKNWNAQVAIYQLKNISSYDDLHYVKSDGRLNLYSPMSLKYDKRFPEIQDKILALPISILEIIFFKSNIAIVWDEMLGKEELLRIKAEILKLCN